MMIDLASDLIEAVAALTLHARRLYYAVMLLGHACPQCSGRLAMVGESRCRCTSCNNTMDPTVAFQGCACCGGKLKLRVRRYQCTKCGAAATSRFVFDGLVFDREYFRQRMAESRHRRQERRERIKDILAESHSPVAQAGPIDLETMPGLAAALDHLTMGTQAQSFDRQQKRFDLNRYREHLKTWIGEAAVSFDDLPQLEQDRRLDRVWRFIAVVFLAHAGAIRVEQEEQTIMVRQNETD